jgi:8-oxo-dGTP pyrophosphatase MutT (NUDIX family)
MISRVKLLHTDLNTQQRQPNTMTKPQIDAWTVVSSRLVLEHPRLTVAEDVLALPDGKEIRWLHFPRAGDFVIIIAINDADDILVSYQYNHPPRRVVDEFPGGAIDGGEDMLQAARRELLEETGWHAGQVQHIGSFLANNRRSSGRGHVIVARQLTPGSDAPEAGEIIVTRWMSPNAINAAIARGEIENVTLLAAWAMYLVKKPEFR